jgi:hypothetical protein
VGTAVYVVVVGVIVVVVTTVDFETIPYTVLIKKIKISGFQASSSSGESSRR